MVKLKESFCKWLSEPVRFQVWYSPCVLSDIDKNYFRIRRHKFGKLCRNKHNWPYFLFHTELLRFDRIKIQLLANNFLIAWIKIKSIKFKNEIKYTNQFSYPEHIEYPTNVFKIASFQKLTQNSVIYHLQSLDCSTNWFQMQIVSLFFDSIILSLFHFAYGNLNEFFCQIHKCMNFKWNDAFFFHL